MGNSSKMDLPREIRRLKAENSEFKRIIELFGQKLLYHDRAVFDALSKVDYLLKKALAGDAFQASTDELVEFRRTIKEAAEKELETRGMKKNDPLVKAIDEALGETIVYAQEVNDQVDKFKAALQAKVEDEVVSVKFETINRAEDTYTLFIQFKSKEGKLHERKLEIKLGPDPVEKTDKTDKSDKIVQLNLDDKTSPMTDEVSVETKEDN